MPTQVPVVEGVWVIRDDGPHLLGSTCLDCGTFAFPPQNGCQRCAGTDTEPVELGNRGTLWTFTVQGFPPKAPPYRGIRASWSTRNASTAWPSTTSPPRGVTATRAWTDTRATSIPALWTLK